MRFVLILSITLLLTLTSHAQEGLGAVPVPLATTLRDTVACEEFSCFETTRLLQPTLFAVNPLTLAIEPADDSNLGLVVTPYDPTQENQVLQLRDDLTWANGDSVNAYDVLYTFISQGLTGIEWMRVLSDYEIEIMPSVASCSVPALIDTAIVSYRYYDVDFASVVADFDFEGDLQERRNAFYESIYAPRRLQRDRTAFPLSGVFTSNQYINDELNTLWQLDDSRNQVVSDEQRTGTDRLFDNFFWGRTNLIVRPPRELWADLRAREDVGFTLLPQTQSVYMIFPMASPYESFPAFDDKGNPIEQGVNPLFDDVRVRRAMQLALDVPAIIDRALDGEGSPLASFQPPASWAYDPTLAPIEQNLEEARRLLYEAGWRDLYNDGTLDCVDCLDAEKGTSFSFIMTLPSGESWMQIAADVMAQQLSAVGIRMNWEYSDPSFVESGYAALIVDSGYNVDFDPSRNFSQLADYGILDNGNLGSYSNSEVETLLEQVRQNPTCSVTERADLLQQVDRLFQEDPPALWLFTVNEYIVTRGITGIQPSAYNPLWNIRDWSVRP